MTAFIKGDTLTGDIVLQYPSISRLFTENRIDFCCGGNRPIEDAIKEQNLDVADFLKRINALAELEQLSGEAKPNWDTLPLVGLIQHIVETHHTYLREELPDLEKFVDKIAKVHGKNHPELATIKDHFIQLKEELLTHLVEEEEELFPEIKVWETDRSSAQKEFLLQKLQSSVEEHDQAGYHLKQIRELSRDFFLPSDACSTYALTFRKLQGLETDTFEHIHLENNLLFKKVLEA